MSMWNNHSLDTKVREILDVPTHPPNHHFGRPFLTSYQIAIAFAEQYPDDFREIDKEIGGQGTGQHHSLAQYFARELSQRISDERLLGIEGRFLSLQDVESIQYRSDVVSSPIPTLSMFRLSN